MSSEVPAEVLAAAMSSESEPAAPNPAPKKKTSRSRAKSGTAAKKQTSPNPATGLIAAIKFISVAQSKTGTVNETFCHLSHHWAAASNGVLTAATRIEEDLNACPQTTLFLDALGRVVDDVSITQLSPGFLSVAAGDFRGIIPCAPAEQVPISPPDDPVATIDDRIKAGFEAVLKVPNESSPSAAKAGILLQAGSIVATDGAIIFEYWHGIDLPPNMLIPKVAAQAVVKCSKPLAKLGFSSSSVTFWFEDGSFIKTQTFSEQYPDYQGVLECDYSRMWPVQPEFFKAVAAVATFSEEGKVFFKEGQIVSDMKAETPSFYRLEGLPEGEGFQGKYLAMIEGRATKMLFAQSRNGIPALFFVGENIRGCIAALEQRAPAVYKESSEGRSSHGADFDDDIPF